MKNELKAMKRVCVFCGSKVGINTTYKHLAIALGEKLVENNLQLVYGGGGIGLMGVLADTVIKNNGIATGVIPRFLADKELGHQDISELIMVNSMHERKQKMAELADGFIALPGGFGTLEELFEILTWQQLRLINKPIGILNVNGFFNHLDLLLQQLVKEGFLSENNRRILQISDSPQSIIDQFMQFRSDLSDDIEKT